ncbi:MAG: response regulator, partial [Cephaloticoccus sp.]|nr:response regulator [Cephaloticoccus sp.]
TIAWREAADRAEAASQAKTVFLANASHELRTPLNAILGYAHLLEKNAHLPDNNRKPVTTIRQSGEHLLRLINQVLNLAKLESGITFGKPESINLRPYTEEIVVAHQIAAQQKGLALKLEIAPHTPPQVIVDSLRLRQVLDNLIGNAVKFTRSGHIVVTITTDTPAATTPAENHYHRLKIQVSDTGPGIAPEDLERIFEPFQQTETGAAEGRGTGLGLALARRMVEMMGGQLSVRSEVGAGTTFDFELALADHANPVTGQGTTVGRISGYAGPRKRLLIVDDKEFNRHLLRDLLIPLGFEIDLASSAAELFARFTIHQPDCVITDLRMPGMGGMEAIRRLRLDYSSNELKIIAHSTSIDPVTRENLSHVGCDAFLPKPFHEAELHDILARTLGLEWVVGKSSPAG